MSNAAEGDETQLSRKKPIRVAVIGGGPAGLVAAFHLMRNEPHAYDLTVYEMSWRLGGKTASGRGESGRIEEHGLHILFGCYHNVFHTLQICYTEFRKLGRTDHRIQYFSDAIAPHHFGVIGDDRQKIWQPLYIEFPSNRGVPGDAPLPSTFDLVSTLFQIAWMVILGADSLGLLHRALRPVFDYRNRWKRTDFREQAWEEKNPDAHHAHELGGDFVSRMVLWFVLKALNKDLWLGRLSSVSLRCGHWLWRLVERRSTGPIGRLWSALDFFFALFRGVIADGVFTKPGGFNRIDIYDLREWLKRYDASDETLGSPWMRIIYDAAFSYPNGGLEPSSPPKLPPGRISGESVAAGAALRALMLMTVTYKGAFYNKMEAGMGDIIHTPLYLVLKSWGVKFEFFHRLTDIKPEPENDVVVGSIEFDTLPTPVAYDPLVNVKDLLCWPSKPLLGQITNAASHQFASEAESYAPSNAPKSRKVLRREADFDAVLLATPVACLPYVCPSLLRVDAYRPPLPPGPSGKPPPKLRDQFQIDTVQTIAVQLWLKLPLKGLGWRRAPPLLSLFTDPLNTWCDMTHLSSSEAWPGPLPPLNIAYFCGPLKHEHEFPPPSELAARAGQVQSDIQAQLKRETTAFLATQLGTLLPSVRAGDTFDYNLLVDPLNRKAEARLPVVYRRANYEPHELCTLALPGKTQWRMTPDGTNFAHLFVSGDWIDNGVYLACVEGTFQAGILSARAIAKRYTGQEKAYSIVAEELLNLKPTST